MVRNEIDERILMEETRRMIGKLICGKKLEECVISEVKC